MGKVTFCHRFESHDWRQGVRELKEEAIFQYGHNPYAGTISCCDSISLHSPRRGLTDEGEIYAYINDRLDDMYDSGEVISLGIKGYSIAKPVIKDYYGGDIDKKTFFRGHKEPAVLISERAHSIIKRGSVAELKEYAKNLVMKEKFEKDYFIVGKNLAVPLKITGEGKIVKRTSRKSSDKSLVLPVHDYVVYGWARS